MILTKSCILSISNLTKDGYSRIYVDGKTVFAHRYALEQKLERPIHNGYEACHHCDVPNCIESEHLYEGTHSQNMKDAFGRGRGVSNRALYQAAKTHCPKGHPLIGDNLIRYRGSRSCKECGRVKARDYQRARAALVKMAREMK